MVFQEKIMNFDKIKNIVLEDDSSESGGISFKGETVGDFLAEVGYSEKTNLFTSENNINIKGLNDALAECGISPIVFD